MIDLRVEEQRAFAEDVVNSVLDQLGYGPPENGLRAPPQPFAPVNPDTLADAVLRLHVIPETQSLHQCP
jgi:hypothetical protein